MIQCATLSSSHVTSGVNQRAPPIRFFVFGPPGAAFIRPRPLNGTENEALSSLFIWFFPPSARRWRIENISTRLGLQRWPSSKDGIGSKLGAKGTRHAKSHRGDSTNGSDNTTRVPTSIWLKLTTKSADRWHCCFRLHPPGISIQNTKICAKNLIFFMNPHQSWRSSPTEIQRP